MVTQIKRTFLFCLGMLALASHAQDDFKGKPRAPWSAAQNLKNYALSACLADGLSATEAKKDAEDAAVGYLELGSFGMDAYREVAMAGRKHLAQKYLSRNGEKLITMRCIDFFHGKTLDAIVKKHLKQNRGHE